MKSLTLINLKEKAWYRLIKVVYIGFFVLIAMAVWGSVGTNNFWIYIIQGYALTIFFFEFFRRIFYYIALGTFLPKKIINNL